MRQLYTAAAVVILTTPGLCLSMMDSRIHEERASLWNERVWISIDPHSRNSGSRTWNFELYSFAPGTTGKPRKEAVVTLPVNEMWLLAGEDRLWMICKNIVAYYKNGETTVIETENNIRDFTPPFLYHGKPAVIEQKDGAFMLRTLQKNLWVTENNFRILWGGGKYGYDNVAEYLNVLSTSGKMHFFIQDNYVIRYHEGIPTKHEMNTGLWRHVYKTKPLSFWTSADFAGRPAIFLYRKQGLFGKMEGYIKGANNFKLFYIGPSQFFLNAFTPFDIYPTGTGRDFFLLHRSIFGRTYGKTVMNGKEIAGFHIGTFAFEPFLGLALITLLLSLLFDAIVTVKSPFWYFSTGISSYRESRTFPRGQIDIDSFMNRNLSHAKSYIIRKWPQQKAITFKLKFMAPLSKRSATRPINKVVVSFNERLGEIQVTIDSKLPLWVQLSPLSFIILLIPMFQQFMEVFSIQAGIPLFLLLSGSIVAHFFVLQRLMKKQCLEFFPHLWFFLGFDKSLTIESPI